MKNQSQNQKLNKKHRVSGEAGITMIALLVTIIILIILTAVAIRTLTGDKGVVKITAETVEDHEVAAYGEQIDHVVQSEIVVKSTIGKIASIENVCDALNREDWIRTAIINNPPTTEIGDITAQVVERIHLPNLL